LSNLKKIVRNKTFIFFALFFLVFFGYLEGKHLKSRFAVQKEISALSKQADQLQKNKQDLEGLIAYYKTSSYKERALREQLSEQKDGEVVYSFTDQSAQATQAATTDQQKDESNVKKWWDYFFKNNY
jgi:cell division protein FtsB